MRSNQHRRWVTSPVSFHLRFLARVFCAALFGLTLSARGLTLAEDGRAQAAIVIPRTASPPVRYAAHELRTYFQRISGASFPVVEEQGSIQGLRLDVGPTEQTIARLPIGFTNEPERISIQTHPEGLHACGGSDRGTIYAVYRLLESLGCRWLGPGEECVPTNRVLMINELRIDSRPAFTWRLFSGGRQDWGLKLGLNGFYPAASAATHDGLFWPRRVKGVHAYHQIVPASDYFASHPEWSPLLNGRREPTGPFCQLCVTATGLVETFSANVIRALDEDPGTSLISISPNDGYRWCECSDCVDTDRRLSGGRMTAQGLDRERPFVGDRVFQFANDVARRVAPRHPDRKLLVLAYVNFAEPPDQIRPEPNVLPFLCHYAPADYSRRINDPASAPNRAFDALLGRWLDLSPDIVFYSYVSKSMWWRLPRPVTRIFADDIAYLHQRGIRRFYAQSPLDDWSLDGPLYYVVAKRLWDPSADVDALIREWTDGMFGPAAEEMVDFYDSVEQSVLATGRPYSDQPRLQAPGLYDVSHLERAQAALARARRSAADEPVHLRRIAAVEKTFRYGRGMIDWLEQHARMEQDGDPSQLASLAALGRAIESYGLPPEGFIPSLGAFNRGFGRKELRGGRDCWNADETGPGDGASGWAEFYLPTPATGALAFELDVWGESELDHLLIETSTGRWTTIAPASGCSGQPLWETLLFRVPRELLAPATRSQHMGLGGGDRQIHIAAIRVLPDSPTAQSDAREKAGKNGEDRIN